MRRLVLEMQSKSLLSAEMSNLIGRMITGLPTQLREVIALSTIQELSPAEIGEVLDISEVTVAGVIWIGFRHLPSTSSETTNVRVTERVGWPASSSHERISSVQAGTGNVHRRTAERRLLAKSGQTFQPRLSEFSSSRPLSEQERLVLAYVKVAPTSEVLAAVARAHDSSDLQIEDLEIAPLAND
jgi:hypothetical protein